ncbi:hypothetical protein [Maribellus mangrovi]|uniref:hypothetical protein n=1 Tax=Maribellus mangrovi TaxID=3133146 RepID=UPI0030ECAD42
MTKLVKIGDKIPVTVILEFEGTVRNHAILVENQLIPTINNERKDFEITLDGDPMQILARFKGVRGSKISKFEISINNKTGVKFSDLKFKLEEIEIKLPVKYSKFDLIETSET